MTTSAAAAHYTPVQGHFFAHSLMLESIDDDSFTRSLSAARVDMNPHQVEASLFALKSPFGKGVLLADEVGLGKTIEAGLVMAQKWAEQKRRILLVAPASLRKQWEQALTTIAIDDTMKRVVSQGLPSKPKKSSLKLEDYAIQMPTAASSGRETEKRLQ